MTQIKFAGDGSMVVGSQDGRIWRYGDSDGDGTYDLRRLFAAGFTEVVGLLIEPGATPNEVAAMWVGGRGQLYRVSDTDGDGVGDNYDLRIDGLPWGRHQNNGLAWNPHPDPFSGEPAGTWIYFGLGSTDDLVVGGELNATILRFPRDGRSAADLEVVSRGVRNAYDVTWAQLAFAEDEEPLWHLFASENGPDFNDAPDEVNHIRWGRDYGFPEQFGPVADPAVDGDPYSGPVYPVAAHASADGLAFIDNLAWPEEYRTLYVSLFGEVFSATPVGHTVERITLEPVTLPSGERTFRGTPSNFLTGLDRPLPLAVGPDGNLIVGDYATGIVYRVRYAP
jgi:glucose/arabinose dehydrogenase